MESYLMMLYVTLEQESALKNFFVDQGWMFCKPDLSVTTDKLGPAVQNPPVVSEEISLPETDIPPQMKQTIPEIKINIPPSKPATGTSTVRRGKRKTKSPKQTAIRIKQAKVASASVPEPSESNENLVTEAVESNKSETLDTSKIKVPITVQVEDGNQFTIKIEQESEDVGNDKGEVDNSDVVGNDDFDDGDDDNDEETNVDYSFEGASTSEGDTSVKMESQSLGNNSTNVNTAAKGGSSGKLKMEGLDSSSQDKLFECGICGSRFKSDRSLKRHLLKHSPDVYTCEICGKSFGDKYYLQRHVKNHSSENVCQYCGKTYASSQILKRHEEAKHTVIPQFKCNVCEKPCSSKVVLQAHLANHHKLSKQEKPFKCYMCNRAFFYKSSLERHRKRCSQTHTSVVKTFKCSTCGKEFRLARLLRQHKIIHSEPRFACNLCGKCFKWKHCLEFHLKCCWK
ncbi:zinc finger protein 287-like isoform X10 [Mercenaria mercenaria]|uniref:zinc finger protein 287-like isoform X10 n=1 Tax=Mercenaria mercenaria TaxID=6596 RepID=UPI00234F8AD3|nr:zinc finger protein 287-like isoform X10 [Mercenaria mercenaria]